MTKPTDETPTPKLVSHLRWLANKLQPSPDGVSYHPEAYNMRKAADEIERLQREASACRAATIEECAALCDRGALLTSSPMYIAACEELSKAMRAHQIAGVVTQ